MEMGSIALLFFVLVALPALAAGILGILSLPRLIYRAFWRCCLPLPLREIIALKVLVPVWNKQVPKEEFLASLEEAGLGWLRKKAAMRVAYPAGSSMSSARLKTTKGMVYVQVTIHDYGLTG